MALFYLSLWAGLLVQILCTQATIEQSTSIIDFKKLQNLTTSSVSSDQLTPLNLRLHDINYSLLKSVSTNNTSALITNIDLSKTLRLKDVLNVFDLQMIASQWINIRSKFSRNCSEDIYKYLQGLKQADMWSVKMDDASGHYSSGFFFGNNYWMGSMSLCKAIYHGGRGEERMRHNKSKNSGLPFAASHVQSYRTVYNDNPPFIPGFYIIKMLLNETYPTQVTRTIYVGACLPSSCSTGDVIELAQHGQRSLAERAIDILNVRMPTNDVNLYEDPTFWILVIVSIIVLLLIAAGTLYEIFLTKRVREALRQQDKEMLNNSEASSGIGCASSDYCDSVANDSIKKDLKELNIVLSLPTHTATSCNSVLENNSTTSDEHLEGHLHESEKLNIYSELLLSFSVITNFKAICDRNVGSDTLPSIHGLRAFSMAWVILGHTCIVIFKYSDNLEMRKEVEKNFFFQAITNGPFSVDTFFFISGCLVSYLYFRTNAKGKLNKLAKGSNELARCTGHFLGLVMYRFMRLTAPYLYVLGVVQVSMKYLAAHSIFDPPTNDHMTCPQYWWRNMLYINTLFPVEQMCMLWSWYLANDTQFYIIGAIILIVSVRHFKLSAFTTCVFLILSWITTAFIAFTHNHRPDSDDPLALFDKIYDKPWTRLGPYLIGMIVGWILFRTNCKIRLSKLTVIFAWAFALLNLFVLVFGLYLAELSQFTAALYSSLSHSAWALSLAWITIACSTGYGGFVNTLLSAPCLYPFSRVTYCAYLVHPIVIRSMALNTDAPSHLGGDAMVIMFFGFVVASYLLSFVVSLSFEAPVVTMLKILSPSRKKRIA